MSACAILRLQLITDHVILCCCSAQEWKEDAGMSISNGAVFWMSPDDGPGVGPVRRPKPCPPSATFPFATRLGWLGLVEISLRDWDFAGCCCAQGYMDPIVMQLTIRNGCEFHGVFNAQGRAAMGRAGSRGDGNWDARNVRPHRLFIHFRTCRLARCMLTSTK